MKTRCPRCGGNIYLEEDCFGSYEHCLQCGYDGDTENIIKSPEKIVLSELSEPSTQNINKQTGPEVIPVLQGDLVAELQQG